MMKKNLLINLPEDVLITNILLSKVLPIESLLSLRCVCKYLWNLITSPAFINMQLHHSTTNHVLNNSNPLVLIKATDRPDVFFSLKFNVGGDPCRPNVVEIVEFVSPVECSNIWGSYNGLVCLGGIGDTVCLWNPFTKEYKILPPPLPFILNIPIDGIATDQVSGHIFLRDQLTYGFGYDRLLDDYKIIRGSVHLVQSDDHDFSDRIPFIEFQVYTLGTNTWRKISTDNNPYKFVLSLESSVVFVNGAFHWIMSTSEGKSSGGTEAKIVSFDIEKEVFQEMQTPSMLMAKFKPYANCFHSVIQVLRGCLCVVVYDSSTEACNVWMMMDYGVEESWTKLFTIFKAQDSHYYHMAPAYYRLLRFCESGTEILMLSYNSLIVYDLINNTSRRVEFTEKMGEWKYQTEVYIESLVSLSSGVYSKSEMRIRSKTNRVRKQERKRNDSTRLLGDMAWRYMQRENYYMAEQLYRQALSIKPNKNKQCNLAICLMNNGRIPEAKSLLQAVVNPSSVEKGIANSYIKSYNRAWKILTELESQSVLNYPPLPHYAPYQQQFLQPLYFQPAYPMFNGVYPVVSLDHYYQYPQQYYQHFNHQYHPHMSNPPYMVNPHFNHQYHPHMSNPYMVNPYQAGFDHPPPM